MSLGKYIHPIAAVASILQTPVHPQTVGRWMRKGVLDSHGRRVKLESRVLGGRRLTKSEWVEQFFEQTSGDRVSMVNNTSNVYAK